MLKLNVYGLEEISIIEKDKDGDIQIGIATSDGYAYTYINDNEAKQIIEYLQNQIKE